MLDQLYGYEVKDGRYRVQKKEAKIIRSVFNDIIDGKSTISVANDLNEQGIRTRKKDAKWYHGMISRMIRNRRYCGELGYPKIVNVSIQNEAINSLENRRLRKGRLDSNERNKASPFYKRIRCKNCGSQFWLYECNDIFYWRCTADIRTGGCGLYHRDDGIKDDDIHGVVLEAINDLISSPELIMNLGTMQPNHLEIVKLENKIKRLLHSDNQDMERIEKLLKDKYQLSYAQYDTDYISETMVLKAKVSKLYHQTEITRDLVKSLIKEILIDENGKITIIFINHQCIEKQASIIRGIPHG